MKVSPKQAIDLELKLNLLEPKRWGELGDILYEWRLNPNNNKITCDTLFKINNVQMLWIQENIIEDLNENKYYYLISE